MVGDAVVVTSAQVGALGLETSIAVVGLEHEIEFDDAERGAAFDANAWRHYDVVDCVPNAVVLIGEVGGVCGQVLE